MATANVQSNGRTEAQSTGRTEGQSNGRAEHQSVPDLAHPNPRDPAIAAYNISWKKLSYSVPGAKDHQKEVLSELNGIAYPGFVVAILGPSGSGKTSLLDVLSGRVHPGRVTGTIEINGATEIQIKHVSRYCQHDEALFGNLTVFETLMYAVDFNLPELTSKSEKLSLVKATLQEFGLTKVKNTIIGSPLRRGCSAGEIRRVSVAAQVIGLRAGILFLDEPTSDLDSVAAEAIISGLCTLAKKYNLTILTTIHQPATGTFEFFTHFLLLAQGKTLYYGDREEAIPYFDTIGYQMPQHANPADVYLQLASVDFDPDPTEGNARIQELVETFDKSEENKYLLAEILENQNFPPPPHEDDMRCHKNGFLHHTTVLMSRAFVNTVKNPLAYWVRVAMYIGLAVLMATTWYRMDTAQTTVNDRLSGLFFGVAFLSFMAVAGIPAFLEERLVFMQERANDLYGVESYVIANLIVSIPFIFIITISFSVIAYFGMGLQETTEKFCTFASLLFMSLMIAEAQTVLISVAIPVFVAALAVCAFTNGVWMVVEGYFVQKKNIPDFWRYSFHQIDFQKYVYEILITNEFTGISFSCNDPDSGACACIIPAKNSTRACEFSGEDVLSFYDYSGINYTHWMLILVSIFLILKILTWLLLKFQTRNHGVFKHTAKHSDTKSTGETPQLLKNMQSAPTQTIGKVNKALDLSNPDNTLHKAENLV